MPESPESDGEWMTSLEQQNEEYRRLKAKHQDYDEKLRTLSGKRLLSDEEKLEEVRMKKEKLFPV